MAQKDWTKEDLEEIVLFKKTRAFTLLFEEYQEQIKKLKDHAFSGSPVGTIRQDYYARGVIQGTYFGMKLLLEDIPNKSEDKLKKIKNEK